MLARQLLSDGVMPLKTSDTGRTALEWMEDLRLMHLPIVNEEVFLGLISELDIYSLNDFDEALGNHQLSLVKPYVLEDQHLYEVLKVMYLNQLTLIPVIDQHEHYMGVITLSNLLKHFAASLSVQEPGAIIVLEMSANDFVLSEIAQIVESHDTKILSLFIHSEQDSTEMQVHLKLNRKDVTALLQTFLRYKYNVMVYFSEDDDHDDLRERFDGLMKYLNL